MVYLKASYIDQSSGKVLAAIAFKDYSIYGQTMAGGMGVHMGTLGIWNHVTGGSGHRLSPAVSSTDVQTSSILSL